MTRYKVLLILIAVLLLAQPAWAGWTRSYGWENSDTDNQGVAIPANVSLSGYVKSEGDAGSGSYEGNTSLISMKNMSTTDKRAYSGSQCNVAHWNTDEANSVVGEVGTGWTQLSEGQVWYAHIALYFESGTSWLKGDLTGHEKDVKFFFRMKGYDSNSNENPEGHAWTVNLLTTGDGTGCRPYFVTGGDQTGNPVYYWRTWDSPDNDYFAALAPDKWHVIDVTLTNSFVGNGSVTMSVTNDSGTETKTASNLIMSHPTLDHHFEVMRLWTQWNSGCTQRQDIYTDDFYVSNEQNYYEYVGDVVYTDTDPPNILNIDPFDSASGVDLSHNCTFNLGDSTAVDSSTIQLTCEGTLLTEGTHYGVSGGSTFYLVTVEDASMSSVINITNSQVLNWSCYAEDTGGYGDTFTWDYTTDALLPVTDPQFATGDMGNANNYTYRTSSYWQTISTGGEDTLGLVNDAYSHTSGIEYAVFDTEQYDEWSFEFDFKTAENLGSNSNADAGVVFGFSDNDNYSYFDFNYNRAYQPLRQYVGGVSTIYENYYAQPLLTDSGWHHAALTYNDGTLTIEVDPNRVVTEDDFPEDELGWTYNGAVIPSGGDGEWDNFVQPTYLVWFNGMWNILYLGWEENTRTAPWNDAGPRYRKLGRAYSTDNGETWTKDSNNPIYSYQPNPDNQEEGVANTVAFVSPSDVLNVYMGGYDASDYASPETSTQVNCSVHYLTTSTDWSLNYVSEVIPYDNAAIVGPGDEVIPRGVYMDATGTYLFYACDPNPSIGDSKPLVLAKSLTSADNFTVFTNTDSGSWYENRGGQVLTISDSIVIFDTRKNTSGSPETRNVDCKKIDDFSTPTLTQYALYDNDATNNSDSNKYLATANDLCKMNALMYAPATKTLRAFSYGDNTAIYGWELTIGKIVNSSISVPLGYVGFCSENDAAYYDSPVLTNLSSPAPASVDAPPLIFYGGTGGTVEGNGTVE